MHKTNYGDFALSLAAFFQIAVLMFQELLTSSNIVTHESSRVACIIVSAIPMVIAVYYIIIRRLKLLLITYMISILIILLTLLIYPENSKYVIPGTFNILIVSIPCFLCLAAIRDIYILRRIMLYLSFIIFTMGIIYIFLLYIGSIKFSGYSMTFSYYLLLPSLVFVNQRKAIFTFLFYIICAMMLMIGSRGALVTALIYAILLLILDSTNRKNILLGAGVLTLGIATGSLLSFSSKLLNNLGVTSRTLDLLQKGDIAQDTGRVSDFLIIWRGILNRPWFGYGIFGDRVVLDGTYSHNLFLELFYNFGFLFGSGLIFILFLVIVYAFSSLNKENRKIFLMFFCYGFIPLMVSGSYLTYTGFAIFIGYLFLVIKSSMKLFNLSY